VWNNKLQRKSPVSGNSIRENKIRQRFYKHVTNAVAGRASVAFQRAEPARTKENHREKAE
jgi:hypothetical protein